jgi:(S)-sulfolactate dehydrogenase
VNDIVITEFMDEGAVEALAADYRVLYDPLLVDDPGRLAGLLSGVRALVVRNRTQVTAGLLESAPDLQVVGRLGVGLDNIDLDACERRDIAVCPATGANDVAVAEYVVVAAMLLLRPVFLRSTEVVAGTWPRSAGIGHEILGKTLGLVGFGGIARETAHRAFALGMKVAAYDPYLPVNAWDSRSD